MSSEALPFGAAIEREMALIKAPDVTAAITIALTEAGRDGWADNLKELPHRPLQAKLNALVEHISNGDDACHAEFFDIRSGRIDQEMWTFRLSPVRELQVLYMHGLRTWHLSWLGPKAQGRGRGIRPDLTVAARTGATGGGAHKDEAFGGRQWQGEPELPPRPGSFSERR